MGHGVKAKERSEVSKEKEGGPVVPLSLSPVQEGVVGGGGGGGEPPRGGVFFFFLV